MLQKRSKYTQPFSLARSLFDFPKGHFRTFAVFFSQSSADLGDKSEEIEKASRPEKTDAFFKNVFSNEEDTVVRRQRASQA